MATSTGTIHSLAPPPAHRSIHTLQDIMSADETITGRPPRIPQHRLPGGRKPRHILAAMENIGKEEPANERSGRGRGRKSEIRDRNGSSFAAAAAAIEASPPSLRSTPPKVYQYRNNSGVGGTKQIEALEKEYLNGGRRKVASPIAEETEDEDEDGGGDVEEEVTAISGSPEHSHPLRPS